MAARPNDAAMMKGTTMIVPPTTRPARALALSLKYSIIERSMAAALSALPEGAEHEPEGDRAEQSRHRTVLQRVIERIGCAIGIVADRIGAFAGTVGNLIIGFAGALGGAVEHFAGPVGETVGGVLRGIFGGTVVGAGFVHGLVHSRPPASENSDA